MPLACNERNQSQAKRYQRKHRRLTWQQQDANVARTQRHHKMYYRQIIEERHVTTCTIYISATLLAGNKHKRSQTQIYERKHLAATGYDCRKYATISHTIEIHSQKQ